MSRRTLGAQVMGYNDRGRAPKLTHDDNEFWRIAMDDLIFFGHGSGEPFAVVRGAAEIGFVPHGRCAWDVTANSRSP